jgi:ATP-dependent DNA helicase DinG
VPVPKPTASDESADPVSSPTLKDVLDAAVTAIGGTERAGQLAMAQAVAASLDTGKHLLVQAGTGTGKSLAYLVPALLHGDRVVVATATIALQTQLVDRDLPTLIDAIEPLLGRRPTFAVLKGRNNYVCRHRLDGAPSEADTDQAEMFDAEAFDAASTSPMGREAQRLRDWAKTTPTGDKLDLEPAVDGRVWRAFSVSSRECLGSKCPSVNDCFAEQARERAKEADVVVTNHALLTIGALEGVPVLPEHDAVIVDEGHELVERATSSATRELTATMIDRCVRRATRLGGDEAGALLEEASAALTLALGEMEAGRVTEPVGSLFTALVLTRDAARSALSAVGDGGSDGEGAARQQLKADLDELYDVSGRMVTLTEFDVAWLDVDARTGRTLRVAPLSVAGLLRAALFNTTTVIMTSATLELGGSFDAVAASVGLPAGGVSTQAGDGGAWSGLDVGSPFDHAKQGILYVAAHLPARGASGSLAPEVLDEIVELVGAAGGRTLGLFSSRWAAQAAADAVRDRIGVPLLTQWDAPVPQVVARFAAEPRTCLFGTLSLWQGVDVPGTSCTLVLIDKIPFPRPDDPLVAARQKAVDDAGRSGFMAVSVPRAALLLAQGVGRLIRSDDDRGVVAVLDPRLRTARYGSYLVASLPPFWSTTDPERVRASLSALDDAATIADASS